ncbi:hypothetical protein OG742_37290 [Streptomyces sp. NBC_00828]|uniref:hypothetical protein n=1 Tax=Streptomyces sp. NBC_00828 TaxID=2903678 RepID=UPI003863D44C
MIVVPMPPDPSEAFERLYLKEVTLSFDLGDLTHTMGQELAGISRVAVEEYRSAIEIGVEGVRQALADAPQAYFDWPRQYGKRELTVEYTPYDGTRSLFGWVDAHVRARRASTVDRIADELGLPTHLARHQFEGVQRVLEDTGIADGYGLLTVPQPVREPITPPAVPRLFAVHPDPYSPDYLHDYLATPAAARRPLVMRSALRAMPAPPA